MRPEPVGIRRRMEHQGRRNHSTTLEVSLAEPDSAHSQHNHVVVAMWKNQQTSNDSIRCNPLTPDQACCRSANKATDPVDYPPTQARIHTCISRKKHPLPEGDFLIFSRAAARSKGNWEEGDFDVGGGGGSFFGYLKKSSCLSGAISP
jgi:hypothetical protein